MPTPWMKRVRQSGQLSVKNLGGAWAGSVDTAIVTFNSLNLGVKLVNGNNENEPNIIVKISSGAETFTHYGDSITVNFPADQLHGRAKTLVDRRNEIYFAAVFLPGRVSNPTPKQREVIIVHELIHAAGLNGRLSNGSDDPNGDHDSVGIMYPQMMVDGDGLIEYLHEKGAKAMTPVRVGTKTMSDMQRLWAASGSKKD